MKKFLLIAILSSIFTCSIFAEQLNLAPEKDESKWTDLNYVNVPILKVLDSKEGYVVIYQKKNAGTASVVIPSSSGQRLISFVCVPELSPLDTNAYSPSAIALDSVSQISLFLA